MNKELRKLKKDYKRMAAKADKQLRELERLSKKKGYENVKEWSYRRAMKDIQNRGGARKRSFKGVPLPDDVKAIRSRMNDVQRFLDSPTSSSAGIKKVFEGRAKTINENFGTNFTWEDLGKVFESAEDSVLYIEGAGATYLKAVSYLKDNEEKIMNDIYDISMGDKIVRTGNKNVNQMISKIIDNYGIQFTDLYR